MASLAVCCPAQAQQPTVDPTVRAFLKGLPAAPPIFTLSPADARQVLRMVQFAPIAKGDAIVTDRVLPIGPTGQTRIRVIRPNDATGALPAIVYLHGGG